MNPVLAEEGRRLSDNYDNMNTDIAVTNHGPCYPCHGTLLKDYYRVDMSLCRYTMSRCCNELLLFGHFMLVFLSGAFSLFSSVAFLLRSLVFLRFSLWAFPIRFVR